MKRNLPAGSGFSLVEVMLATAIFSMGLSGLSLMFLSAVTGTAEAGHQTLASIRARSLAELISLNTDTATHYVNPLHLADSICFSMAECSRKQILSQELLNWQLELSEELPRGSGLVCRDSSPDDGHAADHACDGEGGLVVKVFWQETQVPDDEDDGLRRQVARLPF